MTRKAFDATIALSLLDSHQEFPTDFDRAWRWLGFSRKDNAKRHLIDCGFVEGMDYKVSILKNEELDTLVNPKPLEVIQLTIEAFKTWAMMANTSQGKEIRRYFLECEKTMKAQAQQLSLKQPTQAALPPVPEISKRNLCRKQVDERAMTTGLQHSFLWQQAYRELEYRFGYSIARSRAKNKLEKVEKDEQIDNLLAVMHQLWKSCECA
jgi:phage anti-repressor protein